MPWVKERHRCELPLRTIYKTVAVVGAWFECDHCKTNWQVEARVPDIDAGNGWYNLTFVRREGDYIYTQSWQEV